MAIHSHLDEFMGFAVKDWAADVDWSNLDDGDSEGGGTKFPPLRNPEKNLYRVRVDYDEEGVVSLEDKLARFLNQKNVGKVAGVVVGSWAPDDTGESSAAVVKALAEAAPALPGARALFIGDMTMEECEISWITQSDMGRLLEAYPQLEHLGVRGGNGLEFQTADHPRLKSLVVQSGGLPRQVVRQILRGELPALEHLELWLGEPNYGGDVEVEDLAPLLSADRFPGLKYLGLRNSAITDDIAAVLANAKLPKKLEVLDLSMGTLGDRGAKALLGGTLVKKLKKLDVHHHYCGDEVEKELKALKKQGVEVDVSEGEGEADDDDRYVEVGE